MKLFWVHLGFGLREMVREPAFLVFSVVFPTLFYAMFALPYAKQNIEVARSSLVGFMVYAVYVSVLSYYAIGQAQERASGWPRYRATLPLSPLVPPLVAASLTLVLALLGVGLLAATGYWGAGIRLSPGAWMRLILVLGAGGMAFALLGASIGRALNPRTASALTNLLGLPLAYAGGLWIPPGYLPPAVAQVSPFTPTRVWAELAWSAATGVPWRIEDWLALLGYGSLFLLVLILVYRWASRVPEVA